MKKFKFEIVFAIVLIILYLMFTFWQSQSILSKSQVEDYVELLEQNLPKQMNGRKEFIDRVRAWGMDDNGKPVYMLSLLRLQEDLDPNYPDITGSPEEMNKYHDDKVATIALWHGTYNVFEGSTMGFGRAFGKKSNLTSYEKDNWDKVIITRYVGKKSFLKTITSDPYLKTIEHKLASTEIMLIPTESNTITADLNWSVALLSIILFLVVVLVRTAFRK